jgi:glucose/mannose transport system permease protein
MMGQVVKLDKTADAAYAAEQARLAAANDASIPTQRPRRNLAWTPARIGVYGFLIVAALFFLLPLYVMLVTSVKPMEEIRLGTLFALPQHFTLEPGRRPGRRPAPAWNATASRAASGTRSPSWCRAPSCRSPSAR